MPSKVPLYHLWSNEQLIDHEVAHRRAIAAYATGLTLSVATGVVTFGASTPIVVPIAGFKAYKIRSHYKKLHSVRDELSRRNLSPNEKKKRDVLIPLATTAAVYLASLGIAGIVDVVPDVIQAAIHEPIQESFVISVSNSLLSSGRFSLIDCCLPLQENLLFEAGNKYQAFVVAEVTEAGLRGITVSDSNEMM